MGQGRQVRPEVDATFLLSLRCQSGVAATVRAGVQPGQLSTAAGLAADRSALVADDTTREVDQDRGEDRL